MIDDPIPTRGELLDRLDQIALEITKSLTPAKLIRATVGQLTAALSMVEQARLRLGQTTDVTDDCRDLTDEERAERLAEIYEAARERARSR
ncbi:MAG: hypothetical protein FJX72_05620 [Armatimonadetes bacterium]|nr:hypothetical protein [Armatimonadota bacterium]